MSHPTTNSRPILYPCLVKLSHSWIFSLRCYGFCIFASYIVIAHASSPPESDAIDSEGAEMAHAMEKLFVPAPIY